MLTAAAFAEAPATTVAQLTAAGKTFFGKVMQTKVPVETITAFSSPTGAGRAISIAALDTTNDGVTNFDTLVFFDQAGILPGPFTLLICQGLNGISGAVFGVMMTLVAADLTRGTGRFNLTLGILGVAIAIGASLSTAFAGVTVALFGGKAAYLGLALTGLCGLLLLWVGMPETHPSTAVAPKPTSGEKIGATPARPAASNGPADGARS